MASALVSGSAEMDCAVMASHMFVRTRGEPGRWRARNVWASVLGEGMVAFSFLFVLFRAEEGGCDALKRTKERSIMGMR